MRVTLFGQPCVLHGPLDVDVLRAIHSISPEEIYPVYSPEDAPTATVEQIRKSIEKVQSASIRYPQGLDLYRQRVSKRLDQMAAFFEALENSRKDGSAPLIALAQRQLHGKDVQNFAKTAHKLDHKKGVPRTESDSEIRSQLFDIFSDGIGPDPQEEFHRAIRKLNITYTCSFEEGGGGGGEED